MKASTIFVGALAAIASAAPTATEPEKRTVVDLSTFNQFSFVNQDLQYFNAINGFNLQAFEQLASFNNLNIGVFQGLFVNNVFDINSLLQLQQVALLSHLGSLGAFSNFDLSTIQLSSMNFGLVTNLSGFNVGSLIDVSLRPQIQTIIQQTEISTVIIS